jgi:hypothetical protein
MIVHNDDNEFFVYLRANPRPVARWARVKNVEQIRKQGILIYIIIIIIVIIIICEPTVQIQWEPRHLPTLRTSMACYNDRFTYTCTTTPASESDNKVILVNTTTVITGFQWFNIDLLLGTLSCASEFFSRSSLI